LIIDDRRLFASALHARLDQDPRFEIVGVAADRDEVVQLATEVEPHVVLLDAALSDSVALDATRRIVSGERSPRVLIMAGPGNELDAVEANGTGASAFLRRPHSTEDLIETLELASILVTAAVPEDGDSGAVASASRPCTCAQRLASVRLLTSSLR
jgi:DNA-binding NarL/FixJ family response regulator